MTIVNCSKDGFISSIWGPLIWTILHIISLNYPVDPTESDRVNYGVWFEHLFAVLPCRACRNNLVANLNTLAYNRDKHLRTRETFALFVNELHNLVNTELDKPLVRFEDSCAYYENLRVNPSVDTSVTCTVSFDRT